MITDNRSLTPFRIPMRREHVFKGVANRLVAVTVVVTACEQN